MVIHSLSRGMLHILFFDQNDLFCVWHLISANQLKKNKRFFSSWPYPIKINKWAGFGAVVHVLRIKSWVIHQSPAAVGRACMCFRFPPLLSSSWRVLFHLPCLYKPYKSLHWEVHATVIIPPWRFTFWHKVHGLFDSECRNGVGMPARGQEISGSLFPC